MSSRPWMKWYPADWRGDPKVRACSPLARYVWLEMLGLMHEAEPYGHLVDAGRAMDYRTLSRLIGVDPGDVKGAVKELEARGVFSRTDAGVIFSRRMVRDEQRRKTLQNNGRNGGNPSLINQRDSEPLDNQGPNQEVKPQKPDARVISDREASREESLPETTPKLNHRTSVVDFDFEAWWREVPRKIGKGQAQKAYLTARKRGVTSETLIAGIRRYAESRQGKDPTFTKHPATWLNGECWSDEYSPPPSSGATFTLGVG